MNARSIGRRHAPPLAALLAPLAALLVVALLMLAAPAAHAGRSCEQQPQRVETVERAMALAARTAERLDAAGARVVLLARAGQDLGAYGIRWSHVGFAYRREPGTPWRVVHKLNHCGSADAAIYRQGLAEFFLDDLWRFEAALAPLAPELEARLLPLLADDAAVARLDTAAYNMVAYPWSTRYQQSNQWALETLAMAGDDAATTRGRAQAWLQLQGYQPATLQIGALQRLGARVARANVAFDDHPNEKRFADRIETVTVDSVFRWLERSKLGGPVIVIR